MKTILETISEYQSRVDGTMSAQQIVDSYPDVAAKVTLASLELVTSLGWVECRANVGCNFVVTITPSGRDHLAWERRYH